MIGKQVVLVNMNTLGRGLTCLLGFVFIGQIRPFEGLELIERIGAFIFNIHHPQRSVQNLRLKIKKP